MLLDIHFYALLRGEVRTQYAGIPAYAILFRPNSFLELQEARDVTNAAGKGNYRKGSVAAFKIKETGITMARILSFSTTNCPYCAETIKPREMAWWYSG